MGITVNVTPPPPPPGGGSSGSSSSGSSGGSSSSSRSSSGTNSQPYIQFYRAKMGNKSLNPPSSLVSQAVKNNWSTTYFWFMVRQTDKAYFKSPEAKQRATQFSDYWKAVMPSAAVNKKQLIAYLKGSVDINTYFKTTITKTGAFKRANPYYSDFIKTQRGAGNINLADPRMYAQYREAFRKSYENAGMKTPTGFERMFFRSGLTGDEFAGNLQLLGQTGSAFQWQTGQQANQKQALFNQPGAANLRGRLQNALATQASFFTSGQSVFQAEKEDGLIKQGI